MPRSIYSPTRGRHQWQDDTGSEHKTVRRQTKKRRKKSAFAIYAGRVAKALKLDKLAESLYPVIEHLVSKALPDDSRFTVKLKYAHLQHTSFLYRTVYIIRHVLMVALLILLGILKTVVPVIIPVAGVAVIVISAWATSVYSVALEVKIGDEHIAYVRNQQTFDDIRESVEERIYSSGESEYMMDSIPSLNFVVIEKDQFTDHEEIADTLYNSYQEYIGQSYGLFFDGQLLGTSKNDAEFTRLIEEIVSWYLPGGKNENYTILNSIEVVRDTYPKNYERSYSELLSLFKTATDPSQHKVAKNETIEDIASDCGISVPVLKLLNNSNLMNISTGDIITVGHPFCELKLRTTYQVTFTEVIPYETKKIYTDSLYEGTTQVKQKGSTGLYEVVAEVVELNGAEVERSEVSKKRIKDPIANQILVGTKTIAPSGKFIWPLANHVGRVSSGFGWRKLDDKKDFHRGTDIAADYGTKILAADAGVIVEYSFQENGLGNYIAIDHGNGIISYYGHCSKLESSLKKGSKVYQGQVIAYVGRTGKATGNHLHFALYNKETKEYFDAYPYIS